MFQEQYSVCLKINLDVFGLEAISKDADGLMENPQHTMKERSTKAPIQNEADNGLKNKAYTIAMARTGDPHSATAQFFINVADNGFLDHTAKNPQGWGYAVFGKVVKGQDVVDAIKAVPTMTKGFHENVPVVPVVIEKATVESE